MPKLHRYSVVAKLPEKLQPLASLASNLWWTWDQSAINLFSRIAHLRAPSFRLNPPELINTLSTSEIETLEKDSGFIAQLSEVIERFETYKETRSWWSQQGHPNAGKDFSIAYFSLEFGLHETLAIYSGGLGVLAGDHLKASSDLGLPLNGIGLLYYEGYFSQYLNADGWQQERYIQIDTKRLPITPVLNPETNDALKISVHVKDVEVVVQAWRVEVGLVSLYLLDTNIPDNSPEHRMITSRLYSGDHSRRIEQELIIGVGGLKLLTALGIEPDVFHMNEGHSAFLALQQIYRLMKDRSLSFREALLAARAGNHFTTHTPVPAGNDVFPCELVSEYFAPYAKELGVTAAELLELGRIDASDSTEPFSMTVLAIKASASSNGVSNLHGRVSKQLWQGLWPGVPLEETPLTSLTNGVHTGTWVSREMSELFDRYLGPAWREATSAEASWKAVDIIPDEEVWRFRNRSRSLLVQNCRERVQRQLEARGAGPVEVDQAAEILNPNALTIGFARRFATYKRASLILSDLERLIRLLNDTERPVQFVFAGKAHPADSRGKELIANLVHAQHRKELRGKIIFLEDYDMGIARHMVHGVDVWLNNPRRPLEACGTSGMKVALNGGLNLSVLDGWWCEAFDGENGWSIGQGEEYQSESYHDEVESRSIYDLLEREVIPTFYNRKDGDIPREWIRMSKHAIKTVAPRFSAHRMVQDYAKDIYANLGEEHRRTISANYENIKSASEKIDHFNSHWNAVSIQDVATASKSEVAIGEHLPLHVDVTLGAIDPKDVAVEVRSGTLDVTDTLHHVQLTGLNSATPLETPHTYRFQGEIPAGRAGNFGLSVRVVPRIAGEPERFIPGLMTWWE